MTYINANTLRRCAHSTAVSNLHMLSSEIRSVIPVVGDMLSAIAVSYSNLIGELETIEKREFLEGRSAVARAMRAMAMRFLDKGVEIDVNDLAYKQIGEGNGYEGIFATPYFGKLVEHVRVMCKYKNPIDMLSADRRVEVREDGLHCIFYQKNWTTEARISNREWRTRIICHYDDFQFETSMTDVMITTEMVDTIAKDLIGYFGQPPEAKISEDVIAELLDQSIVEIPLKNHAVTLEKWLFGYGSDVNINIRKNDEEYVTGKRVRWCEESATLQSLVFEAMKNDTRWAEKIKALETSEPSEPV